MKLFQGDKQRKDVPGREQGCAQALRPGGIERAGSWPVKYVG